MTDEMPSPDSVLRDVVRVALKTTDHVVGDGEPGSDRRSDHDGALALGGTVGVGHVDILRRISVEATIKLGPLAHLVEGAADLLTAAATRDNAVNEGALSVVVRPPVEAAALIHWLLDDQQTFDTRCRRYLVWRFDQLKSTRRLVSQTTGTTDMNAVAALEAEEQGIVDLADAAGYSTRRSGYLASGDFQQAALYRLDDPAKAEPMPSLSTLVSEAFGLDTLYSLLSEASHVGRTGTTVSLAQAAQSPGTQAGQTYVEMSAFGLPAKLALKVGAMAVAQSSEELARWYGIDVGELGGLMATLLKYTG